MTPPEPRGGEPYGYVTTYSDNSTDFFLFDPTTPADWKIRARRRCNGKSGVTRKVYLGPSSPPSGGREDFFAENANNSGGGGRPSRADVEIALASQRGVRDCIARGQISILDLSAAVIALFPPVVGWRPINQDTPTDGPSFLVCTKRRNVYVAYRRSDEGERFLHFASGLAREINEEIWGWQPTPEPLPAAPLTTDGAG